MTAARMNPAAWIGRRRPTLGRGRSARRGLAVAAAALLVLAGAYAGWSGYRSHRPVSLAPVGPYQVGRTTQQWVDRSRTDQFAPIGGQPRVLSVWIWYPAAPGATGTPSAYAPGAWQRLHTFGWGSTAPGRIRTGTLDEVPFAAGTFPLVVLMPGLGFAAPQYTAIASALAARGYVVAGVTPTYSANLTVLDGRPVPATKAGDPSDLDGPRGDQLVAVWAQDARFAAARAVVQLAGHVDGARVVYAGHSFGGAASLEACRADPRCAGAADLDGTPFGPVVRTGLSKPVLVLSSPGDGAAGDPATRSVFAAGTGPARAFTIDGVRHFDFTDYAAYHVAAPLRLALPLGRIGGRRALAITSAYLGAFADTATRGVPWAAPACPEVHAADLVNR
jgi:predicted dienelactone hydrolase